MFNRIFTCLFLFTIILWFINPMRGMALINFIFTMLMFFIYPIGLFLLILKNDRIFENSLILYRIKETTRNDQDYVLSTLSLTFVYSFLSMLMIILIAFDFTTIENLIYAFGSLSYVVLLYSIVSVIYLILSYFMKREFSVLISISLFLIHTFLNLNTSFLLIYFADVSSILRLLISLFILLIVLILILYKISKKREFDYET